MRTYATFKKMWTSILLLNWSQGSWTHLEKSLFRFLKIEGVNCEELIKLTKQKKKQKLGALLCEKFHCCTNHMDQKKYLTFSHFQVLPIHHWLWKITLIKICPHGAKTHWQLPLGTDCFFHRIKARHTRLSTFQIIPEQDAMPFFGSSVWTHFSCSNAKWSYNSLFFSLFSPSVLSVT